MKKVSCLNLLMITLFVLMGRLSLAQPQPSDPPEEVAVINFEQILGRLINGIDKELIFRNKTIDLGNFSIRKIDRLFRQAKIDSGFLILDISLKFFNCNIIGKGLSDLKMNSIVFKNCNINSLSITNIKAKKLEVSDGNLHSIRVLNSVFDEIKFTNLKNPDPKSGNISIFKSMINESLLIEGNGYYQNIGVFASELTNLRFAKNETEVIGMASNLVKNEVLFLDQPATEVRVRKNTFESRDTLRYTFDFHCEKLVFIENELYVPVLFADSKIAVQVEMAQNRFRQQVDFHDVSFPEFGKYVPFSQFEKGFVVYENLYGEDSPDGANCFYCKLYQGKTDEELADKTNFDKLVQSYEILFLGYKSTGDIESANLSYIRIKDLYLNRLGYLYRTNGGFKHYFRWKLAQLLKVYTNHGTDPALSIVISIYVILIFAVFYVFYPSEWDVTSKARLISDFRQFADNNDKGRLKPFLTLLIGFTISILNAITLSLNSFVTLGFGTIPTTGAARYVCILQGFIGWFLLSIFTVSLINQILF